MVKEERLFSDLDKSILTPVKLANGEKNYDYGTGSIHVETSLGQRTISNIFLVPRITRNLLSVGQLVNTGHN